MSLNASAASFKPRVAAAAFVPKTQLSPPAPAPTQTVAPDAAPASPAASALVPSPNLVAVDPVVISGSGPAVASASASPAPGESWDDDITVAGVSAQVGELSVSDVGPGGSPTSASASSSTEGAMTSVVAPTPNPSKAPQSSPSSGGTKKKEEVELKAHDEREHLNIVFVGHVDAGKSTISGQMLLLTGQVDKRTIEKYEKEAKEKHRESWYLAFIMDTNEEERAKGKTVEVGRAHFETVTKRYTILDAPGHKNYVPNMIGGASQVLITVGDNTKADVGVLVISARKSEFEAGFDRGGQTREHATLCRTLGVNRLIVVVNKMDEQTVNWEQKRYDEVVEKLSPFLKGCGYNLKKDVQFIPISGFTGANMKDRVDLKICPWYGGPCLVEALDAMSAPKRDDKAPIRMPVQDRYKEMGVVTANGKLESGTLCKGAKLLIMPTMQKTECLTLMCDDKEVEMVGAGENVSISLKGIEEEDVQTGYLLCSETHPCKRTLEFDAQLLEHKPILSAGYNCVLHAHSLVSECSINDMLVEINKKTGKPKKKKPTFCKSGGVVNVRIAVEQTIAVELFSDFPRLGRFTLRDEGKTIAIGKILQIYEMKDAVSAAGSAAGGATAVDGKVN